MNEPIHVGLETRRTNPLITIFILLVLAGWTFSAYGQTLTTLWSFAGGSGGTDPRAGLIRGGDDDFYGTTRLGGNTNINTGLGFGAVFRIDSTGNLTNLHSFNGYPTDGANPLAPLIKGTDGNFYGTTANGGASTNCSNGCGTVFRITPGGILTNLYSFSKTDGGNPSVGLVQGTDGYFYGTAQNGGAHGWGTVFRINASGTLTTLWDFCSDWDGSNCRDGGQPLAGLVQGSNGNFYGTTATQGGGTPYQMGTVFEISPSGTLTTLYSFGGASDGGGPQGSLIRGSDGYFYGTTPTGGGGPVAGSVFKISPSGSLTNVCSFDYTNGGFPVIGLVQGSDGNFYGVAKDFGAFNHGTIYRVSPSGNLTNLHSFTGGIDGNAAAGALIQGSDGCLYGATPGGGAYSNGIVFKLTIPLSLPANQVSSIGMSGSNHIVTIPSVAGETYQLQFSSSMIPTNWVNVSGVSVTNSIGALLTLTNFGGALQPQGFYRFDITP